MKKTTHYLFETLVLAIVVVLFNSCSKSDSVSPGSNGTGGSMARFAITGDYLYTLDNNSLRVFDISQPGNPVAGAKISIGGGVETLFPYNDKLFVGSRAGLTIYDNKNPKLPEFIYTSPHFRPSCDPVVVQGNYAYVTLHAGSSCGNMGVDVLNILDITDLKNPKAVSSTAMINPHGLGIDGDDLFVSEGDFGLKVFNVSDPGHPRQTQFIQDIKTYDVIPQNKILLVTGKEGLYQYDYSDSSQLKLLSTVPIAN